MKSFVAKYGWKTILGTLLLAAGQIMAQIPELQPYASTADAVGTILGGIGLRLAIAKGGNTNA